MFWSNLSLIHGKMYKKKLCVGNVKMFSLLVILRPGCTVAARLLCDCEFAGSKP